MISVTYNPRGDRLVSGDWIGEVKVWDVSFLESTDEQLKDTQ